MLLPVSGSPKLRLPLLARQRSVRQPSCLMPVGSMQAGCHGLHWALWIVVLSLLTALPLTALPETRRVDSVKSLTHVLSQIEEENGDAARFTTMKLQIYLEDVYISQGTAVVLRPEDLSVAIGELIADGRKRKQIARLILRRYQDGEFHDA